MGNMLQAEETTSAKGLKQGRERISNEVVGGRGGQKM